MDFEEFFRKKRIDLSLLQQAEPALFSEFKTHYTEMGEKSFDHTKKYWFNKLRREYPLAVEPKTEKVKIDNPLAEQTITESLIDTAAPPPKLGFVPKFKAANIAKPEVKTEEETSNQAAAPAPKLVFKPKFKPAAQSTEPQEPSTLKGPEVSDQQPSEEQVAKPTYKPRFNPKNLPKKEE